MIITLLLLCTLFIFLCHYLIHRGRYWQFIDQIPGPQPFLLVGNISVWYTGSLENLLRKIEEYVIMYYPIAKVCLLHLAIVFISHPDDVKAILNNSKKHIEKGYFTKIFYPWLGNSLGVINGTKWHERRKMLNPAFHFNILKQYINILIKEGNYMTQCLKANEELIVHDLLSFTSHHSLNAICETVLGISMKHIDEYQQQYYKALHEVKETITTRVFSPWLYSDVIFALLPMSRKQAKYLKIVHGFAEKIIAERKQYHETTGGQYLKSFENDTFSNDEEITGMRRKLCILDLLIAASHDKKMSDLDIREEVDTFLFAGHDTIAVAMCYIILLLAEHKDIQDCVRSEVSTVMQEYNGELTMTALNNMPYLERCLKESLRLYPSAPLIFRTTSEDVKLQSYIVPAKTLLGIPIKLIHRNPDFWPNPDVFDPDRFLPENIRNQHPFSYLPFSAGPRNCIGQRFAMLELKAFMAILVHNFYLEPISYLKDLRFQLDLVIQTVQPIRVKFIPIEQTQPFEGN